MTERDHFERDLERAMAPRPAPTDLRRRIARIPLDHPRGRANPFWQRWRDALSGPWLASMSAAAASLAVGLWLGFSGLVMNDTASASTDEELVSLVFPSVPSTLGDEQ